VTTALLDKIRGRHESATSAEMDERAPYDQWRKEYAKDVGNLLQVAHVEDPPTPPLPAPAAPEEPGEEMVWTARIGCVDLLAIMALVDARTNRLADTHRTSAESLELDQLCESRSHLRSALACFKRGAGFDSD
jgi:hypothetical protein